MNKDVFEAFNIGNLSIPGKIIKFDQIEWSKHPTFEGVELKHIITGKQTEGQFSYHLVRIAPGKAIKNHIHETQLETHVFRRGQRRTPSCFRWYRTDGGAYS